VRVSAGLVVFTSWTLNPSDGADKAAGVTPVPFTFAVCGEFKALSLTVSVPVRVPSAVGVKVIEIVQLSFVASVLGDSGQSEVWAKSPEIEIPVMVRGTVWVLVRTMALAGLVVCTTQLPKD
jgi:hypothetical protein